MSNPSYEQARVDFEYLEELAELSDQVELDSDRLSLMQTPTKARAAKMYAAGCRLWMEEHRDNFDHLDRVSEIDGRYW